MNPIVCPGCKGKGAFPPNYYDCSTCMGSGRFDTDGYPTDMYGAWYQDQLRTGGDTSDEEFARHSREAFKNLFEEWK